MLVRVMMVSMAAFVLSVLGVVWLLPLQLSNKATARSTIASTRLGFLVFFIEMTYLLNCKDKYFVYICELIGD